MLLNITFLNLSTVNLSTIFKEILKIVLKLSHNNNKTHDYQLLFENCLCFSRTLSDNCDVFFTCKIALTSLSSLSVILRKHFYVPLVAYISNQIVGA